MARKHETSSSPNKDGSTHHTKHSYKDVEAPGYRRSHDRSNDGSKSNDHQTDQSNGRTYWVSGSSDGKHKAGDVTDSKGNVERRDDGRGFSRWLSGKKD